MSHRTDRALRHVASHEPSPELRNRAVARLIRSRVQAASYQLARPGLFTINFHPDRPTAWGGTVIKSVLESGRVLNQFESATTNGLTIDEKEGARVRRESEIFGGAYDNAEPNERPRYGAVNLTGNPRGAWPRYGSAHWVLDPTIAHRCTVTVGDSISPRSWWGTYAQLGSVLADVESAPSPGWDRHRFRLIDGAVELQVHGDIVVGRDIVGLWLDPSFRGTRVEDEARHVSERFQVSLDWAPELRDPGIDWHIPERRAHARSRVAEAVRRKEAITAAWIGTDLSDTATTQPPMLVRHAVAQYLWNRLLLEQSRGLVVPFTEAAMKDPFGPRGRDLQSRL